MIYTDNSTIPYYKFHQFNVLPAIQHYVATRHGGVSTGQFASLNISLGTADKRENILENRKRIAQALGIPEQQLVFPSQTHSTNVQHIYQDKINQGTDWLDAHLTCTDALITNDRQICLSVISADCVPLLLFDPIQKAIGAVHAGWRGTVEKIARRTVQSMEVFFNTRPENLLVGIGPSIGPESYEVGPEVIEQFNIAFGTKEGLVQRETADGKGYLNLWEANIRQLEDIGVLRANIEVAGLCTLTHADTFFSARSYQGKGGRFASGIMLA